jgi:mono/diheme cytochrome c family protein
MSKRPFVLFGIVAALCLLVIPFIALGKEGDQGAAVVQVAAEDEDAKALFADNCGACHTLAAAGTDGVVGPDLDDLLVTSG